jgi:DNA primase
MAVMEQFQNYDRALLTESSQFTPPKQIEMPKEFISLEDPKITVKIVDDFLAKRGFDPTTTRINHSIHYSPGPAGDYKFRIAWPVYIGNQLVTFMTRDVTGRAKVPYIAQPVKEAVIPCKHTLYGYDDVAPGSNIVIVEGPIDQMKLGRGALATWGTGWTIEQVALIKSLHPNKVTILYDSEEIAQEAAKRLDKAIWFCPSEVMYLDDHNDPGELTLEEGREIMRSLT